MSNTPLGCRIRPCRSVSTSQPLGGKAADSLCACMTMSLSMYGRETMASSAFAMMLDRVAVGRVGHAMVSSGVLLYGAFAELQLKV